MDAVAETRMDVAERASDVPVRTRYAPRHAVDLVATLGPLFRSARNPTCQRDGAGVWLTQRTPQGAASLRLTQDQGAVDASAWGPGAEWAIDRVPRLLGSDDDWTALDVRGNAFLADALRRSPGLRLLSTGLLLEALVPAVIEQKVTTVEAWRAWRTLVSAHGEPAPGPAPHGMRVFPTAEAWRMIPSWEWHRAGVDPRRSRTALAVASVATAIWRMTGSDAPARLQSIPGVGPWTVAEASQRAHGNPDLVSVGDYHLPAIVGWALIGKPVDDDGMLELLQPWAGHRQRVMRLILASGFHKPRRGPRMTIQDHRRH
ncbi:MAG TPA: DNA-3-methyladenine glycosylase 2 family protein [Homoserinimonas sp.]|nr:DNA-3-methyladenine glycosylase 2 family protein [Homoserinimonas sp.]